MKKIAYVLFIFLSTFSFSPCSRALEKLYQYRIEYYYDGILEKEATTYKEGNYASLIMDYETKNKDGYSFSHSSVDDAGMTITENEDANVIKVFYEKKETSAKVSSVDTDKENVDTLLKIKQALHSLFDFFKTWFAS